VVPDVFGSCSFLTTPKHHLNGLAPWSFNGAFLGHIETNLSFGGLRIVVQEDDGIVRHSADFSDPRGIGQPYRFPSYDCYFLSYYGFLPRLMAFESFFKLLF
jgi:hypothetical protein